MEKLSIFSPLWGDMMMFLRTICSVWQQIKQSKFYINACLYHLSWSQTDIHHIVRNRVISSWCHQMETFSALLALCARNSPVSGEFPSKRTVMHSFDGFFYLRLNKWLSKQLRRRWFEVPSCSLWYHCNESTSDDGFPSQGANDMCLQWFICYYPEQTVQLTVDL